MRQSVGHSLLLLVPCGLVCLLLAATSETARAGRLPRYGGSLRLEIFFPASPSAALDPLKLWGDDGVLLGSTLYDGLVHWGPERLEPGLALRWFHDENFTRWLFELSGDVRFHDGSRCDAQAVSASLHRLANPRTSKHAWILRDLVGWDEFVQGTARQVEGIAVLSDTEIELRTRHAVPDLPARLSLPAAAITRRTAEGLFGTGPFRAAVATSDSLHFLAFDASFEGRPFLDALDLVTDIPRTLALSRRTVSRVEPRSMVPVGMTRVRSPARRLALCLFHPASSVVRDAATRERIVTTFDASVFVRAGLAGDGEPAPGFWPDASTLSPLEVSGSESVRESFRGSLRILVAPGEPALALLGERLQLHLSSLGFTTILDASNAATFRRALSEEPYDLVLLGWTPLQGHAADCDESTRVLHLLSHLLHPILGASMPPAWRDMLEGRRAGTESSLRQGSLLAPIVFFHDLWQTPDTVYNLRASAASPRLGFEGAHLRPSVP